MELVEIRDADPVANPTLHAQMRQLLVDKVQQPNAVIALGAKVIIDFSDAPRLVPLRFAPCVQLFSVASFPPMGKVVEPQIVGTASDEPLGPGDLLDIPMVAVSSAPDMIAGSGRTPGSPGPLLKFGKHSRDTARDFIRIVCDPETVASDHVRISGIRIEGPSLGQQTVDQFGVLVERCLDIELSNNEVFGWGGAAIRVLDVKDESDPGPGQEPPFNRPGDRIGQPDQVRILNNYIHHNQHESTEENDGDWNPFTQHAAGYGVDVHHGAWAQISRNLFDFNRHAIAASGYVGGYVASQNLVLKGGGYHGRIVNNWTHLFDVHGTGCIAYSCGQAGAEFIIADNAFQYRNDNAIKIRGKPRFNALIRGNVFPHPGLEDDWGDDAIALQTTDNVDIGPGNRIDTDTYGKYGVCDFDGDQVDDLFLATQAGFWFSSFGELPWSFLGPQNDKWSDLRLGYFDGDKLCDVLAAEGDNWVISSGGKGRWTSIGNFGVNLSEIAFGRFDPNIRDHRPGVTRRTTHAFHRRSDGMWLVTALETPNWQIIGSSNKPLNQLRFGDFTGDGVTDVLAIDDGKLAISESGRSLWRNLNPHHGDGVAKLYIADLNNNNVDDLIRLDAIGAGNSAKLTWWVSDDGKARWRKLKSYTFAASPFSRRPGIFGLAGRFGTAPGGGVLVGDFDRIGHFFSEAERIVGANPDWQSTFHY